MRMRATGECTDARGRVVRRLARLPRLAHDGVAMPFTLTILDKPGYLHFKVAGENTEENVRDYLRQIHDTCVARNCTMLLVEENLNGPNLSTLQMFQLAAEGSARSRSILRRVAYVDTNPEHAAADTQFVETVAVNRGMNVRAFATVPEAEAWLTSATRSQL